MEVCNEESLTAAFMMPLHKQQQYDKVLLVLSEIRLNLFTV